MRASRLLLVVVLAGCGAGRNAGTSDAQGSGVDAPPPSDAMLPCTTTVTFQPTTPVAGPGSVVVATGVVSNAQTFSTYKWVVKFNNALVTTTQIDQFGEVVSFPVPDVGGYQVHFEAGMPQDCVAYDTTLQVNAPGANTQTWRLRVSPPPGAGAPPQELPVTVTGGADDHFGRLDLEPGSDVSSTVVDGGGAPVAAYLRFTPLAAPDTFVEAFSSAAGAYQARVMSGPQGVLIVPASSALAPARIASWSAGTPALTVPAADTISGTLLGPGGQPLAGARVALAIAGVPTTIAITDAGGAWSVLGHLGGAVDVTVVPPASSGLPELVASGTALDATKPIAIAYAAIATIDLAGTPVQASGAAAPAATITFTGSIAAAGSITAGATTASAAGVIAATATATAGGLLGAAPVPRAPMTAVVATSPAVLAVVAIDTTGGAPASIDAPGPAAITGTITDPAGAPRGNARVRLTPTGALATATLVAPSGITGSDGRFSIPAAPGGHYALAAVDLTKQLAEVDAADVTAGDTGALALGPALTLDGVLGIRGSSSQLVEGAALTLLCSTCTGLDRSRPVAQGVSITGGQFFLAVPDPGTSLR
jgi:hypothetical protein